MPRSWTEGLEADPEEDSYKRTDFHRLHHGVELFGLKSGAHPTCPLVFLFVARSRKATREKGSIACASEKNVKALKR